MSPGGTGQFRCRPEVSSAGLHSFVRKTFSYKAKVAIRRDPEDLADAINVTEMTHGPLRNKPSPRCHRILSSAPLAIGERCLCFIHEALGAEGHNLARTLSKSSGCSHIAPSPSSAIFTDQGLSRQTPRYLLISLLRALQQMLRLCSSGLDSRPVMPVST